MKIFCAYAFTGEPLDVVTTRMKLVVDTLNAQGHEAYCNRFDPIVDALQEKDDTVGIFKAAFGNIEQSEAVVAIITSPNKSVGQIMEIGAAMSQGKHIYLFEHTSAANSSYLPKLVQKHYTWETDQDLVQELSKI